MSRRSRRRSSGTRRGEPRFGVFGWGVLLGVLLGGCDSNEPANDEFTGAGGAPTGGSGGLPSGGSSAGGTGGSGTGGAATGGISGSGGAEATGGSPGADGCHEPSEAGPLTTRLPCRLSETGLYRADMETLAEGVRPFRPSFQLWSDGAEKLRWIALPAGAKIDTTEMDFWHFPAGTKLWKEFTRDGVRVETRLIEKRSNGSWWTVAYQWRSDQMEADAVPNGVIDASGTPHDIPSADDCLTCHGQQPDKVLGFSALQLSHEPFDVADESEWTLGRLMASDVLTAPPSSVFSVPGTEVEREFFGYLHANCGHCHNPRGSANVQTGLDMWLKVADVAGPVSQFSVYQELYDVDIVWVTGAAPNAPKRVAPGSLESSAAYQRFVNKGQTWSMPPLGTEVVDATGKQLFESWIQSLE